MAAGPWRPRLALPWQRLREGPGAAGAPQSGPGSRTGGLPGCHSFLDFSSALFCWGSPRLRGSRGTLQPQPWAEFPGSGRPAAREGKLSQGPEPCCALRGTRRVPAPATSPPLSRDRSFLPRSGGRSGLEATIGVVYTRPSSGQSGSRSLALGLCTANLPISLAAADGVQRDPAAAAAASSITGRMPGRAAQASPAAP